MDPRTQILCPLQCLSPKFFDLPGREPVRGVVLILVPVGADQPVPEVFEAEPVVGATAAQGFEDRRWSGGGRRPGPR